MFDYKIIFICNRFEDGEIVAGADERVSRVCRPCRSWSEYVIWQYNRTPPPVPITMTDKEKRTETIVSELDLTFTFECNEHGGRPAAPLGASGDRPRRPTGMWVMML